MTPDQRKQTAARLFGESHEWVSLENWESGDQNALLAFIRSETGSKLLTNLKNEAENKKMEAIFSRGDAWQSGIACGFALFVSYLQSLSVTQPDPESGNHEAEGDLARYAP